MSYYDLLNLSKDASVLDIKKAYHKLAKMHHPDRNRGKSSDMFLQIKEAYDVLSVPESKFLYDNYGQVTPNFNLIEEEFLNGILFDLDVMLKRGCKTPEPTLKIIKISILDYLNGKLERVKVLRKYTCSKCDERGVLNYLKNTIPCSNCNGTGLEYLFPCGTCYGNGRCIVNYEKCDVCSGLGYNEETTFIDVMIPKRTSHEKIIKVDSIDMSFKIEHDFLDAPDVQFEKGDVVISRRIGMMDWLCGCYIDLEIDSTYSKKIKLNGAFDLSKSYEVADGLRIKFQLTMDKIKSLRKLKPVFRKVFNKVKSDSDYDEFCTTTI